LDVQPEELNLFLSVSGGITVGQISLKQFLNPIDIYKLLHCIIFLYISLKIFLNFPVWFFCRWCNVSFHFDKSTGPINHPKRNEFVRELIIERRIFRCYFERRHNSHHKPRRQQTNIPETPLTKNRDHTFFIDSEVSSRLAPMHPFVNLISHLFNKASEKAQSRFHLSLLWSLSMSR
jgi:hypothetical protein